MQLFFGLTVTFLITCVVLGMPEKKISTYLLLMPIPCPKFSRADSIATESPENEMDQAHKLWEYKESC